MEAKQTAGVHNYMLSLKTQLPIVLGLLVDTTSQHKITFASCPQCAPQRYPSKYLPRCKRRYSCTSSGTNSSNSSSHDAESLLKRNSPRHPDQCQFQPYGAWKTNILLWHYRNMWAKHTVRDLPKGYKYSKMLKQCKYIKLKPKW